MNEPEFSRILRVDPLPRDGLERDIEATPEERAALAKANDLVAIARLTARLRIVKSGRGVRVEGGLSAEITQTCVVSLEPFEAKIEEPIDVKFLPADPKSQAAKTFDEDAPDELVNGRIDIGALVGEFFTLALDPYPRKPGVDFAAAPEEPEPHTPLRGMLSHREEPE